DDADALVMALARGRPKRLLAADEVQLGRAAGPPVQKCAPDDLVRGVVAAHRVDGDAHRLPSPYSGAATASSPLGRAGRRPLRLDLEDLTSAVRAAARRGLVWMLRGAA